MHKDDIRTKAICDAAMAMTSGIGLCIRSGLIVPALVLLYSNIDQMAYLAMPEGKQDVDGAEFTAWCDKYLLPERYPSGEGR